MASDSYSNLIYCGADSNGDPSWCCSGGWCCDEEDALFTPEPQMFGTIWFHAENTSVSSTSIRSAGQPSTVMSTSTGVSTGQRTSSSSNPTSLSPTPAGSSQSSLPLAVGAGVGVPLGVLALGIIGFLVWRERRTRGELQRQWKQQWQIEQQKRNGAQDTLGIGKDGHRPEDSQPSPTNVSNVRWHELPGPQPHELDGPRP